MRSLFRKFTSEPAAAAISIGITSLLATALALSFHGFSQVWELKTLWIIFIAMCITMEIFVVYPLSLSANINVFIVDEDLPTDIKYLEFPRAKSPLNSATIFFAVLCFGLSSLLYSFIPAEHIRDWLIVTICVFSLLLFVLFESAKPSHSPSLFAYIVTEHLGRVAFTTIVSFILGFMIAGFDKLPLLATVWQVWLTAILLSFLLYAYTYAEDKIREKNHIFICADWNTYNTNPLFWLTGGSVILILVTFVAKLASEATFDPQFWFQLFRWLLPIVMFIYLAYRLAILYWQETHPWPKD